MPPTEIRERRRTLRYRHLLVRQMVQLKNRVSRGIFLKAASTRASAVLLGGFVHIERELPAQHIDGGFLRRVGAFATGFPDFSGDGVHVGAGDGGVHGSDMHHAPGFHTVQPGVAADGRGVVKLEDKLGVGGLAFFLFCQSVFSVRGEFGGLLLLAFVFAEVLDDEGLHVGDAEQAFAGGVDGEASEVAGDPTAVEFFCDGGGYRSRRSSRELDHLHWMMRSRSVQSGALVSAWRIRWIQVPAN